MPDKQLILYLALTHFLFVGVFEDEPNKVGLCLFQLMHSFHNDQINYCVGFYEKSLTLCLTFKPH